MTTPTTHYTIERHADVPLEFDGVLLADVSSRDGGRVRWSETRIYRTESGKYVTETVGRSSIARDRPIITVTVCDTPGQVRDALYKDDDGRRYLTNLDIDALNEAAELDPALSPSLPERI